MYFFKWWKRILSLAFPRQDCTLTASAVLGTNALPLGLTRSEILGSASMAVGATPTPLLQFNRI